PVDDVRLVVDAQVVGRQQYDVAGCAVHHGAGIAAGVGTVIPDDSKLPPGAAVIPRACYHQVDVAGVTSTEAAAFCERQERPIERTHDGRDAIRVVAGGVRGIGIGLDETGGRGGGGGGVHDEQGGQRRKEGGANHGSEAGEGVAG